MKYIYFDLRTDSGSKLLDVHNNIVQINFEAYDRGTLDGIADWGVFANKGTVSFFDYENAFFEVNKQINSGSIDIATLDCYIWLSSNFRTKGIGVFSVDSYTYNEDTKEVIIQLKDPLLRWQDIPTSRHFIFNTTSLLDIFITYIEEYGILDYNVTTSAYRVLKDIQIYCPDIEVDTLWGVMTKICEASGCRIYTNADGIPEISGDTSQNGYDIVIRPYHILNISNVVPKFRTRCNEFALSQTKRQKYSDININDEPIKCNIYEYVGDKLAGIWIGNKNTTATLSEFANSTVEYGCHVVFSLSQNSRVIYEADDITAVGKKYTVPPPDYGGGGSFGESGVSANVVNKRINFDWRYSKGVGVSLDIFPSQVFSQYIGDSAFFGYFFEYVDIYVWGAYYTDENNYEYDNLGKGTTQLPTNTLIQTNNTINGKNYAQTRLEYLNNRYNNGVECCEMECILNDYYDDSGDLILDASGDKETPQTFSKYDVVVPYVIRNGIEVPYRTSKDGTPMRFLVTGIKYSYKGFLRQTLRLMEYI